MKSRRFRFISFIICVVLIFSTCGGMTVFGLEARLPSNHVNITTETARIGIGESIILSVTTFGVLNPMQKK